MKLASVIGSYLMYDLKLTVDNGKITVTKGLTPTLKVRARFDLLDTKEQEQESD